MSNAVTPNNFADQFCAAKSELGASPTAVERLNAVRGAFFGNDSLSTTYNPEKGISLKEGGCLLPPHYTVMRAMQESMRNLASFSYQIYPDQNVSKEFIADIRNYFEKSCGITQTPETAISIGFGSSHIFDALLSAVCTEGGTVLAPESYYHSFADYPTKWKAAMECVKTKPENGYKLTADELTQWLDSPENAEKKINLLVLWNPGTTGALYTQQEQEDLARVIKDRNLLVYCDEVFRDTEFNGKKTLSLGSLPGMENHIVTGTSGSKNRSVANFRIGWACGPADIMKKINHTMDYSITDIPLYLQHIGRSILAVPTDWMDESAREYETRADLVCELVERTNDNLNAAFGTVDHNYMTVPYTPEAGHYAAINMDGLKGFTTPYEQTLNDSHDLTFFLYDPERNDDATRRVAFSSGYSKGHDDMTLYVAFAQLGYDKVTEACTPDIQKTLLLECTSGQVSPPALPPLEKAYESGRDILREAFRRVEASITLLNPPKDWHVVRAGKIQNTQGPAPVPVQEPWIA